MRPAPTFVNYIQIQLQNDKIIKQLRTPRTVIFTRAGREPTHSNSCGPLSKKTKFIHPCFKTSVLNFVMQEIFAMVIVLCFTFNGTVYNQTNEWLLAGYHASDSTPPVYFIPLCVVCHLKTLCHW